MSYSERQLHCLDAMGIVAWTSSKSSDAVSLSQPDTFVRNETVSNNVAPSIIDELGDWLVRQPLTPLAYKGREASYIGSEHAALTIVCLQVGESAQLPLTGESSQLFDLMMRAIEVPRAQYRQCSILTKPSTEVNVNGIAAATYLEDILTPNTRAVLVLDPFSSAQSDVTEENSTRLPSSSVPLWRIPHPDLLLQNPALKRQAWDALKKLRQVHDRHAG